MIGYDIKQLDIRKIADSGQTFRMEDISDASGDAYRCIATDKVCTAGKGIIECPPEDEKFWKDYFDLDTDYEKMSDSIDQDDAYLCCCAEYGRGIRILRQDPWEMLITFIISQRRSIPSIKTCVERLCGRYGRMLGCGLHAFPTPEELSAAGLDDLADCGLGYRSEYVYLACRDVCSGELDLDHMKLLSDDALFETLVKLRGVGPKVANCVCLFGFHRIGAFPVDVWIDRVLKEHYPCGFPMDRYEGYAGVMQQYMFYAARSRQGR